jgi:hypothetical protein
MIPSANVIGNGFLISKDALDKTRRKSLISRLCDKPIRYASNSAWNQFHFLNQFENIGTNRTFNH